MRIAVTGGSGKAGYVALQYLSAIGHHCINVDKRAPKSANHTFRPADLTDYEAAYCAFDDIEAIVHFAGNSEHDKGHWDAADRFENNALSMFNVLNAAHALGIGKVVWISSQSVYGVPFAAVSPKRFPLTEDSPRNPQNGYALTKSLCEDMAQSMARMYGLQVIGLRVPSIFFPEGGTNVSYQVVSRFWHDTSARKFNLWGYVDVRDLAAAVELSLKSELSGAETFNIAADDTLMQQSTRDLITEHFPQAEFSEHLAPFSALISSGKARDRLGFAPRHSWQSVLGLQREHIEGSLLKLSSTRSRLSVVT